MVKGEVLKEAKIIFVLRFPALELKYQWSPQHNYLIYYDRNYSEDFLSFSQK